MQYKVKVLSTLKGSISLLQWGIDRFAQANAVGVAETGGEGGSRRLTDEVSIMLITPSCQRTHSIHARRSFFQRVVDGADPYKINSKYSQQTKQKI